jgi:hypothetical protein
VWLGLFRSIDAGEGPTLGEEIWDEPVRGATFPPHLLGLSGIEQLRLFLDGKAAPPPSAI